MSSLEKYKITLMNRRKERVKFLAPLNLTIRCEYVYVEPKKYIRKHK